MNTYANSFFGKTGVVKVSCVVGTDESVSSRTSCSDVAIILYVFQYIQTMIVFF